jgi:hypothetical protein
VGTLLNVDVSISIDDVTATEGGQAPRFIDSFVRSDSGGVSRPIRSAFGPDVNADGVPELYVVSEQTHQVLRYDGTSGTFLDTFVGDDPRTAVDESGGLIDPMDLTFGPGSDGDLYVLGRFSGAINRYDRTTGAFLGRFIGDDPTTPAVDESGGLTTPLSIVFGPDGNAYVTSRDSGEILRYDGTTGAFIGIFATGLTSPLDLVFGPDGHLYVSLASQGSVVRFDGMTGAFLGEFVAAGSGLNTWGLAFGPDGDLYVGDRRDNTPLNRVARFDGTTGAYIEDFAAPGTTDLNSPHGLDFDTRGILYAVSAMGPEEVMRFGRSSMAVFTVSLSRPSGVPVTVYFNTVGGGATGSDFTAASGTLTFAPGETRRTLLVETLDDADFEGDETFFVNLSNPIGGVIVDGQGVGTIQDDELPPTRFYVVDDAAANKTFEYAASGSAVENYDLSSGNTAPRGAASTAAGDRVWVGDVNRSVYVYDPAGGLVGSWTAGSLPAKGPQVQGIATDGADVWIVDAKSDKVYRYSGAASRTSGSQNAASSFALNSGNKSPVGIVTDGTYLWVVNNASQDKVFKYTLTGSLLGSWTISGGGGSPTGITIDPANVSHIWIVDSNADRVDQFDAAATRTSGTQSPGASFALAAGNSNPQGIADPPRVPTQTGSAVGTAEAAESAVAPLAWLPVAGDGPQTWLAPPQHRDAPGFLRQRSLAHHADALCAVLEEYPTRRLRALTLSSRGEKQESAALDAKGADAFFSLNSFGEFNW